MRTALYFAAFLAFAVGLAHSLLGERYILIRLFRREDLPKLFGGTAFTTRTLRFAWHLTTLAWWGLGAILIQLGRGEVTTSGIAAAIAAVFLASATLACVVSRGRHLAWPVFLCIGLIACWAARS